MNRMRSLCWVSPRTIEKVRKRTIEITMTILLNIIITFLLLIYPANNADALLNLATTADAGSNTDIFKAGCEYAVPLNINQTDYVGHPFENPESIESQDGLLETTLEVKYAKNRIADCEVNLRSYNGKLVGPTLRAKPGDTIRIKLINNLPPQSNSSESNLISETTPEGCEYQMATMMSNIPNIPHNFNTTNFHTHGLHVDPNGCSDNILRVMKPKQKDGDPAPEYAIEVKIPEDHPSGTFWYHAHLHGSTALQVSSGMAGTLIIEGGGLDEIPEIAEATEKVFMFQQIAYDRNGEIENYDNFGVNAWDDLGRYTTINSQIRPVIKMRPGEVQRWRFIHGGVKESLNLELRNNRDQITLHEIAVDGIALGKLDSWNNAPIELEPGYRSDVLVQAQPLLPGQESQEYILIDKPTSNQQSLFGKGEPGRILAKVIVEGKPLMMQLPNTDQLAEAKQNDAPKDIRDYEITGEPQKVVFSIDQEPSGAFAFTVNGQSFNPQEERLLQLNQAEIWHLETDSKLNPDTPDKHPFHIHVNPFQYDRKDPHNKTERIWRDTLMITEGQPQTIRTRYTEFPGKFVLHCHILDHEDQGMMQVVEIVNQPTS